MLKKDWVQLPEEIRVFVLEQMEPLTSNVIEKFELSEAQRVFILDVEDNIILKKNSTLDLANELDKMPEAKNVDIRLLALDLAYKIFWPLQDYLGSVDRLILRLGGTVPRQQTLRVKKDNSEHKFSGTEQDTLKNMLGKYKDFSGLRLTSNKIINKDGKIVYPTVENWIEDYVHFLGAGDHDSLKRARYLSKSENVLQSSDKEKSSLRYFFVSYDENVPMYFNLKNGILEVEEIPEDKEINYAAENKVDISKILDSFYKNLQGLESRVVSSSVIMSEAENDINKVRDILWNAIGIGDNDKALGCLKLLIVRKSLDAMIKEDNRFKNILKRFIGVKYGQNMERALDDNLDKLIARRIFLEMVLADKLKLKEDQLYSSAFYLSNVVPNSGQIVYLDKKTQKFKWLEIQVVANKFAWVDKI